MAQHRHCGDLLSSVVTSCYLPQCGAKGVGTHDREDSNACGDIRCARRFGCRDGARRAGGRCGRDAVTGDPSVVLLTLGRQDKVTWEESTQGITTRRNDCRAVEFADSPELLVVSPIGGQLGEVKDGLGVQGPNDGSGEPCGRIEDGEGYVRRKSVPTLPANTCPRFTPIFVSSSRSESRICCAARRKRPSSSC